MRVQYGTSSPVRPLDPINPTPENKAAREDETSSQALASTGSSKSESSDEVASTYRVQRGDTLVGIAQRFGVSVRQLRAWNDLPNNRIHPGQRLRIVQ